MFKPVFWFLIFSLFLPGFVVSQEVKTEIADGAILRGLDKVSGKVKDIPLYSGDTATFGTLSVLLKGCRFPLNNLLTKKSPNAANKDPIKRKNLELF